MFAVSGPELRMALDRARGNQRVRYFHGVAASEEIVKSIVFVWLGSGPKFRYADWRVQDGGAGFAQFQPFCNDAGILSSRDFDENVGIH